MATDGARRGFLTRTPGRVAKGDRSAVAGIFCAWRERWASRAPPPPRQEPVAVGKEAAQKGSKRVLDEESYIQASEGNGSGGLAGTSRVKSVLESPKVNGYGIVATPSPAPGVNDSPLMTWGEIESTPLRLEGSDTPYVDRTPGPAFKILEPGRRERLGLKMANEAAAKNRAKKQEALRRVTENLASLIPKGLNPAMSPAMQRLVNRTASKFTDKALRASYTSSPAHLSTPGYKTPAGGPQTPTVTTKIERKERKVERVEEGEERWRAGGTEKQRKGETWRDGKENSSDSAGRKREVTYK
ncbi:splicing factor ESS-2 homolog [Lacerta agilis]|uniref:splicing factor ESS-2 homolog n=1 Tax=Lacerta agilis TaxID=80427 RepID=UPI0014199C6B|nr:splicing factor ESS-2 homolog [Lacerta agilis]